jgi:cystathionine beta-synthase
MRICDDITQAIGNTPLVRLNKLDKLWGVKAQVLCKVEYMNPGGSMKDRIGLQMVLDAEEQGLLKPGGTIVECTSGNTGVGLALAAITRGYRCIFVMPDKMSREKIDCLRAYGAEVVTCPTAVAREDPRSYYSVAARLTKEVPGAWHPNQYHNMSNPKAHYLTTGPEIWRDTGGRLDAFVTGMGTGGTISGVGKYLKEKDPKIQLVGVDPVGSMYYDKFHRGVDVEPHTYLVEGIGEDFYPSACDLELVDDVIQINDLQCYTTARKLARLEGIFSGSSTGAAVWGALEYCKRNDLGPDKVVVVLITDSGMRYLSKVYSEVWLRENGMLESQWSVTAREVIRQKKPGVVTVPVDAPADKALKLMKEHGVSQIPVMDGNEPRGAILEEQVLDLVLSHKDPKGVPVRELMRKPFPVVGVDTPIEEVATLLKQGNGAVLVKDPVGGQLAILTKHDLVAQMAIGK